MKGLATRTHKAILIAFIAVLSAGLLNNIEAKDLYKPNLRYIAEDLNVIESRIYGKTYDNDNINDRISRLERTFYGKRSYTSFRNRVNKLKASVNQGDDVIKKNKQIVLIELMEKRYLGQTYPDNSLEERITRLEIEFFKEKRKGNLDERYDYLIENALTK